MQNKKVCLTVRQTVMTLSRVMTLSCVQGAKHRVDGRLELRVVEGSQQLK